MATTHIDRMRHHPNRDAAHAVAVELEALKKRQQQQRERHGEAEQR